MNQRRPGLGLFALLALLLFGGAGAGDALGRLLAPGSFLAEAAGFAMLPLSLGLALSTWYTVSTTVMLSQLAWVLLLRRPWKQPARPVAGPEALKPLPATFVLFPVPPAVCFVAGIVISLAPTARSWLLVVFICTLVGLLYGLILWRLARAGFLPLPDHM